MSLLNPSFYFNKEDALHEALTVPPSLTSSSSAYYMGSNCLKASPKIAESAGHKEIIIYKSNLKLLYKRTQLFLSLSISHLFLESDSYTWSFLSGQTYKKWLRHKWFEVFWQYFGVLVWFPVTLLTLDTFSIRFQVIRILMCSLHQWTYSHLLIRFSSSHSRFVSSENSEVPV